MATARFTGSVHGGHKGAAVECPFDPAVEWGEAGQATGAGKRGCVVLATIKTFTFETTVVSRAHRHWVLLDDHVLEDARIEVGQRVTIAIRPLK